MSLESEAPMHYWIRYDNSVNKWEPARIYNKSGMILKGEKVVIARIGWLTTLEGVIEMQGDEAILRDENDNGAVWKIGPICEFN